MPFPKFAALVVAAVIGCLAGCASAGTDAPEDSGQDSAQASAVGIWRADAPATAWLQIADDGTVTGSDGCNPVNGTASVDGDTVAFDLGFTTLKACSGVTISFVSLHTAEVAGDSLSTRDADGAGIIDLRRASE